MKLYLRVLTVIAAFGLLAGCATGPRPPWTYVPATPSAGASAQPSGAPPTAVPNTDDSVLPALTAKADLGPVPSGEVNVAYAPNVPAAATRTDQAIVDVQFDIVEGVKVITADGKEYETWGFRLRNDGSVLTGTPGPIIRARVGDVLRMTVTNPATNKMPHNIDFHAVTGPGGGAKDLTVAPGQSASIEARLLYPGMFMYHCAFGDVPLHISQGMYGGILVDPETPLDAVEREAYIVQSEFYTTVGPDGQLITDRQAITDEKPTYVVFNGAVGALTGDNALQMRVGETMRIYFVNAGLNLDSNFHPIGSQWDKVYQEGALLNAPLRGSQTTLVPAGGASVVELVAYVPQTVVLVDHALARAFDKGAIGQIVITGEPNPEIYEGFPVGGSPPPTVVPSVSPVASPTPVASLTPAPSGTGYTVEIVPGAFTFQAADAPDEYADTESPADYSINVLMVPLGATVAWINNDPDVVHTVTASDGSFDSGFMASGQTFSNTFDTLGEYQFFCTPHPWMRAKVIVEMH